VFYGRYHLFYDRDGQPIEPEEWAVKHGDLEYLRVAVHHVRGWTISTVWLGIDHGWGSTVPIIFETMIFAPGDVHIGGDDDLDDYQERYATVAAANAGHDRALAAVLERLGPGAARDVIAGEVPDLDPAVVVDWDQLVSGAESGATPETSDQDSP
jgi:hypothetical protein